MQVHISVTSNKWLPSPTQKFINLAIIKKERIQRGKIDDDFVQKSIRGQIDDILLEKSPIKLEEIFSKIEGERKVILIDGAPGSGKTSLTVHVCQRWSRGELFEEFTVVILVQLRDPAVQSAKSIADLLPSRDDQMAEEVARVITASDGRGVLWVLDGYDELPSNLREKSFLKGLILLSAKSPISLSSVIVTSRPISSGDLCELASSRIEVLGFTREEQRQYFTECLKGDTKAVDTLTERLSENPGIEDSCYLPLNASIVAHLYLSDGSVPNTVYSMFSSFVQHFLSRYLYERLGKTREEARLRSLDNLPSELRGPFNELCALAFNGTSENKVTFSESDLEAVKHSAVIREVGLLQSTPSIISNGKVVYYNFTHLSVQEVLTSVYISRLPASEQISTFDRLFGDSRFGPVLQYYAAITKLRTSRPWLSKLPSWLIPKSITVHMLDIVERIIAKGSKPLLVSLLHCLYEAQDPSLCQFVAEQLGGSLYLSNTSLTPVDCLAIGYFVCSVTLSTSNIKMFRVNLNNCSLGDVGTKSLMRSISRHIDCHSTVNTHLEVELWRNDIHEEGASHIAEVLNNTSIVSGLLLSSNPIGDKGLRTIFNSLKQNNTLKDLDVSDCGMTDAGVPSLAEAMSINTTLERLGVLPQHTSKKVIFVSLLHCLYEAQDPSLFQFMAKQLGGSLDLSGTSLTPVDCLAIGYFLSSVTLTTSNNKVFTVNLYNCSLGDAGTKSLMCSISRHIDPHSTVNTHLDMELWENEIHEEGASHIAEVLNNTSIVRELSLHSNPIGDKGLQTIFNSLKQNNTLKVLNVSHCGMTDAGVPSLAESMSINTTLERLVVLPQHTSKKVILVSLLHCLYEAQDLSLFQFMAKQLGGSLDLSGTSLTPVDCLAIGYFLSSVTLITSNNKVFTVNLYNCSLGDAGTKSLMCSISRHIIDPHSTVNTHLDMELWENEIHEEGASHITEVLNNTSIVRELSLHSNPIGDKGLQSIFNSLKQNNTLKVLNVSHCGMTDAGVPSLAESMSINTTLERLVVLPQHTSKKVIFVSLLHCLYEAQDPSLFQFMAKQLGSSLDLSGTSLTPVDCLAIGYFLSSVTLTTSNNKVFTVNLYNCSLGDAGTKSLMCSISRHIDPHSTVNTHLDVGLGSNEIHEEGASHIAEVLNNTSIVSGLWLRGNPIGDKGLQTIFNSLKQNNTLKFLSVSRCDMIDAGVPSLAEAMNINTTLEILDIGGNPIGDKGLQTVFNSLKQNNILKVLSVYRCDMTDAGVPSLAEAMNINTTLEILDIGGNPIGDKGLQTVFNSLRQNNTLKVLSVSRCDMTDAGVPSLAEAMNINTTLERLYIYSNDAITDNGLTYLVEVLSRRIRLVLLWIPGHLKVDEVRKTINEARERSGLEAIEVEGKYA